MSGGGKPKSGLMSNKIVEDYSEDQIKTLIQQIQTLESQLGQLKAECDKFDVF